MATRKKGLGRGLDVLLGADAGVLPGGRAAGEASQTIATDMLQPGSYQPRSYMDEGALQELADSIKQQGVLQPILVRALAEGAQKFEIIAGERRFRAAILAGLQEVPVIIREVSDQQAAAMALIENMQREDLNPLEEAQGVRRLLDDFGLTHEQAATAIGRSRSATSNLLRLLNLAEPVQTMLLAGDIDMGHARALLAVEPAQQIMLANEVVAKKLSVRETEKKVAVVISQAGHTSPSGQKNPQDDPDKQRLERILADRWGTTVNINSKKSGQGELRISFSSWEHLNSLLERYGLDLASFDNE